MVGVIVWILVGIMSLIYFISYAVYIGLNNSFTYFWFLLGMACTCIGILKYIIIVKEIQINKIIKIIFYGVLIIICGIFVITEGAIIKSSMQKEEAGADYIIVLGARVNGKKITTNLKYRLDAALDYLKENNDTKVIVSGGQGKGEDITEAEAMKQYLMKHSVSDSQIIKEERSVNTDQNLKYSMDIIKDKSVGVVIVSNDFHIYRAKKIAAKQGYQNVSGIGSKTKPITVLNSYVREGFAVIKYKICRQI